MQIPRDAEYTELLRAFYNLSSNPSMAKILEWIRGARDAQDKANRIPGQENKCSAAHALTTILDVNESALAGEKGRQL